MHISSPLAVLGHRMAKSCCGLAINKAGPGGVSVGHAGSGSGDTIMTQEWCSRESDHLDELCVGYEESSGDDVESGWDRRTENQVGFRLLFTCTI